MLELSDRISSAEFAQLARHPDHPRAFTRSRQLPLPALIGALLSMRNQSQQATLDGFFASLCGTPSLQRCVSDRAFAKARDHLHLPALSSLNDLVVQRADSSGLIQRWCGLRVVAADASVLMPAVRPCLLQRSAAGGDQRLFSLYLPGAELTLHASVHGAAVSERAMLMEALSALGPDDVLVLDRGYPAAWLVALLNARGIRFVMRCDSRGGWAASKRFVRSDLLEQQVLLNAPSRKDVADWACPADAPEVRLIRQVAPNGQVRVLATNLDARTFPHELFRDLYHQRWRIEEAFKRLKHRLHLEAVSGLSQQALIIDVAAKVLSDNLTSLMCQVAEVTQKMAACASGHKRKCNRAYAATVMQRILPRCLLLIGNWGQTILDALRLMGSTFQRFVPHRSQPRSARHVKPHPSGAYKG